MECDHATYDIVHDASSGDRICTGCGLVLESHMFEETPNLSSVDTHNNVTTLKLMMDDKEYQKVRRYTEAIQRMGHTMHLTDTVIETAVQLLHEALSRGGYKVRQNIMQATAASALYYACKIHDADRAELEMAPETNLTSKQLAVTNKRFRRALVHSPLAAKINAPANPIRLIPRFLDRFAADMIIQSHEKQRIRRVSEDIGSKAIARDILVGKSPICCCIAFMYLAMRSLGYPESVLETICKRAGLTPNTISNAAAILSTISA